MSADSGGRCQLITRLTFRRKARVAVASPQDAVANGRRTEGCRETPAPVKTSTTSSASQQSPARRCAAILFVSRVSGFCQQTVTKGCIIRRLVACQSPEMFIGIKPTTGNLMQEIPTRTTVTTPYNFILVSARFL
ncbi:hypothetical protein Bbelb_001060 [Branchiostoma belcheri]|nr:hypothetical protein Bbelb_001060 [Branchiostoma belcheri]